MADLFTVQIVVPILLVVGLLASVEVGYRLGRRHTRGPDAGKPLETGAYQGAMLGLLGLLLGFSFAGAAGRFIDRQDLVGREANAIRTAYLRAGLLDEPHASSLKAELTAYVDHRVEASHHLQRGLPPEVMAEIARFHERIWAGARAGVEAKPRVMVLVINAVNDVIALHGSRVAAGRKHLPGLVLSLLVICSILTLGVIGYACALAGRRNATMTSVLAILIGAALWTTIDLDRARIGLIRISDAALVELHSAMHER